MKFEADTSGDAFKAVVNEAVPLDAIEGVWCQETIITMEGFTLEGRIAVAYL